MRVSHPGLRAGAPFGAALIVALLHLIAPMPFGAEQPEADAHLRVHGKPLPVSELARAGKPRWTSIRRWIEASAQIWPGLALPVAGRLARLRALLSAFSVGGALSDVVEAALGAHRPGGAAM